MSNVILNAILENFSYFRPLGIIDPCENSKKRFSDRTLLAIWIFLGFNRSALLFAGRSSNSIDFLGGWKFWLLIYFALEKTELLLSFFKFKLELTYCFLKISVWPLKFIDINPHLSNKLLICLIEVVVESGLLSKF
jgi:hypothetical protein